MSVHQYVTTLYKIFMSKKGAYILCLVGGFFGAPLEGSQVQQHPGHVRTQSLFCVEGSPLQGRTSTRKRSHSNSPQFLQVPISPYGSPSRSIRTSIPLQELSVREIVLQLPSATEEIESKQSEAITKTLSEEQALEIRNKKAQQYFGVDSDRDSGLVFVLACVASRLLAPDVMVQFLSYTAAAQKGDEKAKQKACDLIRSGKLKNYLLFVWGENTGAEKFKDHVERFTKKVSLISKGDSCQSCKKAIENGGYVTKPCLHVVCEACVEKVKSEQMKQQHKESCPCCQAH